MKNVRFLTRDEILETDGGREGTLSENYATVRKAVEKLPGFDQGFFINPKSGGEDADFPDDDEKVDVTFGLKDEETGEVLIVWNYKSGPAYNPRDNLTLDDISEFSIGYGGDRRKPSTALLSVLMEACDIAKH